ncbi:hypothetical protein NB693_20515 [Pantoea ananatis]|uniref:hypothetical protein n=1 Tax=Pantoea ananas TaxID=553 RepID=UPI00221ECDC9|nr:hypothetical protein [Pantoea ananatis]
MSAKPPALGAKKRGLGRGLEARARPRRRLKAQGVIQPIVARELAPGSFEIVAPLMVIETPERRVLADPRRGRRGGGPLARVALAGLVGARVEHRAQQFAAGKVPSNRKAKPARTAPQADIASLPSCPSRWAPRCPSPMAAAG